MKKRREREKEWKSLERDEIERERVINTKDNER